MQLTFSLSELNKKSPYVLESSGSYSFTFITSQGKKYEIGFIQDLMISDEGVYQFFITTEDQFKTVLDNKIRQTVLVVIEEFFKNEGAILDYICATEDHGDNGKPCAYIRVADENIVATPVHLAI